MPDQVTPPQEGILNKSLADVLKGNPQAQNLVMKSMGISQQQLQSMLSQAGANPMMNMPISELFKNGFVQQAVQTQGAAQASPQQVQQMLNAMSSQNPQGLPAMPQNPTVQMPQNMQGMQSMGMPVMIPVGVAQMPVNGNGVPIAGMQLQKPSLMQKIRGWFK